MVGGMSRWQLGAEMHASTITGGQLKMKANKTIQGRPTGLPKTGGRKKGSLDRQARTLITEELAGDILATYRQLGGQTFLLEWAQANKTEFVRQCLTRLMPAPPKDEPDTVNNTLINVGTLDDMAIARRIAFALSKAIHGEESPPRPASG